MEGAANMQPVNSIAVLLFKTTSEQQNESKISEISVVGCERGHILKLSDDKSLPRVIYKMKLPLFVVGAADKNDLTNGHSENSHPFDTNFMQMLNIFLGRLCQPVCLISHGDELNFPSLKQRLLELNNSNNIFCVDSKEAFQHIFPRLGQNYKIEKIYRMLHDYDPIPDSHTSEGVSLALLSCIVKVKDQFFAYVDQNLKPLNSIEL